MKLTRLSHICLSTSDISRTVRFYADILGCKVIHEFKNAAGEVYGVFLFVNNNTFLEFFFDDRQLDNPSRFRHICFEVSNIDELAEQLTNYGFTVELRRGRSDGVLQFWINDPDGNQIEFHQYDERCVQFPYVS